MTKDPENLRARLDAMQAASGLAETVISRFGEFIATAAEEALFRASPLRYAAEVGLAEHKAIELFVHAAHVGLFDFNWGVLCPACAAFLSTPGGLRGLAEGRRCGFCRIPVASCLDDNVEVAFTVAPTARHIRFHDPHTLDLRRDGLLAFFSSSVPATSPVRQSLSSNVLWGGLLGRDQSATLRQSLVPGRYVLLAPASHTVLHFEAREGGPEELAVELFDGRAIPEAGRVASGATTLSLANRIGREVGVLLLPDPLPPPEMRPPQTPLPSQGLMPHLTGKRVLTSQAFRDLFRAQSLPGEGGLELKNLTVLFTDLKRSTDMYEQIGDLRAFGLVRQHFAVLRNVVAEAGGAVVKTIGDAIMASFAEPRPAMHAAVAMHEQLARVSPELSLKVGVHMGRCIAVELNDRLDYFGGTVNVAARVQGLAEAQEVVCSEAVWNAPGVADDCCTSGLEPQRQLATLRGVRGEMPVVRVRVPNR